MNTKKHRIGIIPNSPNYDHPQDRRRYIPYFNAKGIGFETANYDNDYDILYVSLCADLNKWCNYKTKQANKGKNVRIILDMTNLYLVENNIKDSLRSIYHFFSGRTSSLRLSYKNTILKMIKNSDVILAGSIEQKHFLDKFHKNIYIVRDFFDNEINTHKINYELTQNNELNILWEGFASEGSIFFKMLVEILDPIEKYKINIHIITDPEKFYLGGKYFGRTTYNVLKNIFGKSKLNFFLYSWNTLTFNSIASKCDLALIPIPKNKPFLRSKPENKLLLLWLIGLPVITSNTDSYVRVMKDINMNFTCDQFDDWRKKILQLADSLELRESYLKEAKNYLKNNYSKELIFANYDDIFFN